jgi:hypothetical protein
LVNTIFVGLLDLKEHCVLLDVQTACQFWRLIHLFVDFGVQINFIFGYLAFCYLHQYLQNRFQLYTGWSTSNKEAHTSGFRKKLASEIKISGFFRKCIVCCIIILFFKFLRAHYHLWTTCMYGVIINVSNI